MEINIKDFERTAKKRLDSSIFDFFYGAATDETTLQDNEKSYSKFKIMPKVLNGVQDPDTSLSLFGQTLKMPILIAPMAFQKLCHPNGELEAAKGARQAETIMIVSTYSTTPFEKLVSSSLPSPWFQLYILKDRNITKNIIKLAESTGYTALVLTVDAPIYGKRERELRNPLMMNIILPDLLKIVKQQSPKLEFTNAKHFKGNFKRR
jgi:4-hydroxymandelate oxidase